MTTERKGREIIQEAAMGMVKVSGTLLTSMVDAERSGESLLAKLQRNILRPPRYRWWHAVGFEIVAQLIQAPGTVKGSRARQIYRSFKQAPFAPPGWVFGPVWAINNAFELWGNLRLLNLPANTPNRTPLLWLQGASWGIFCTFSYAYFVANSPILAFTWTASMYVFTIASMVLASKIDAKIVWSLATLCVWLSLATAVALYQMVYNPDPLFGTAAWR